MTSIRALALPTMMFAAMLATTAAHAAVWPGAVPCAATLQECIDAVPAAETVLVATDTPVVEDLSITKSLTLTRQPGFSPTISGQMLLASGASSTSITLSGLAIEGPVRAVARAGDLELHVLGNSISSNVANRVAVELTSDPILSPAGDLTAEVEGNDIRVTGASADDSCGGVVVLASTSPQTFAEIVHNTLFVSGCGRGVGIGAATGVGRVTTVDVLRNRLLVPNTGFGISLQNSAPGPASTLSGRIVGNLVHGEFFGVGVNVVDAAGGTLTAQVSNNTIVEHDTGMLVIANAGDPMTGEVSNTIVAFNTTEGLRIDAEAVLNCHDLVFGNGVDSFVAGPGTIFTDPQFVGGSNFHLLPGSPAIDAGANDTVPGDVALDLDGAPRIQGGMVDIGAFEEPASGSSPIVAVPALSSLGLVLLPLALAGAALYLLRRGR